MIEPGMDRKFYLPRLARQYYQADAVIHWTMPVAHHQRGWLSDGFHSSFRELVLHTAAREGLLCPAYCLMPDHLHLVFMGLRRDSDQLNAVAFLRTYLEPALAPHRFQHQAHDHVLKQEERRRNAFAGVCSYILENPVKAKLVEKASEWKFCGAVVPGYPTLHPLAENFWRKFWEISCHQSRRCGKHHTPANRFPQIRIVAADVRRLYIRL
jgi:REP element-mobilizing transposase RayT